MESAALVAAKARHQALAVILADQDFIVGSQEHPRLHAGRFPYLVPEIILEREAVLGPAEIGIRAPQFNRITSYNVCYTKLLRHAFRA